MSTPTAPSVADRFAADIEHHRFELALADGQRRHLRFQKPGTGMYWFEVVTWSGALVIRGDMGTFVFSRVPDMFEFFRGQRVNPQYWAEKEITGAPVKRFDEDRARRLVREHVTDADLQGFDPAGIKSIREAAQALVDADDFVYAEGAHRLLAEFSVLVDGERFEFHDTWEWDLTDYTYQYLWCCQAIVWAIEQYDQARRAAALAGAS